MPRKVLTPPGNNPAMTEQPGNVCIRLGLESGWCPREQSGGLSHAIPPTNSGERQ